ncbi:MAG TPA: YqgE/AlgH family protein [Candidatus Binataceae bacterium]|nr:YqgE/AlgH family protein [Candidatus Binataceae bacterium]
MAPFKNRVVTETALVGAIAILAAVVMGVLTMPGAAQCARAPYFLVAKPELPDPRFQETVILMLPPPVIPLVEGVIINKPTTLPVSRVFPKAVALTAPADMVYSGGPVDENQPLLVRLSSAPPDKELHVFGDLYVSLDPRAIAETLKDPHLDKRNVRLFFGYAQWSDYQLQAEKMENSWYEVPARADQVFGDPKELWRQLVDHAQLQEVDESPSDGVFGMLHCAVQLPALSNLNRSDR